MDKSPQLYLASASPRRRELLAQIGVYYRLLEVDVPEHWVAGESPECYVVRLALEKARAGRRLQREQETGNGLKAPVLGADTAVVIDGEILGKPATTAVAETMLTRLSGRSHIVLTGVALAGEREASRLSVSRVFFREISAQERSTYCATGEPLDKAGAYAIQGRGAVFVSRLEGSYSGVVGLPLFETAELLDEFNVQYLSK